jgi:hypothetical protein
VDTNFFEILPGVEDGGGEGVSKFRFEPMLDEHEILVGIFPSCLIAGLENPVQKFFGRGDLPH